jgi:hypothetical protein
MLNYQPVVGVAQLVERRSVAPNVAGSIPVSHPTLYLTISSPRTKTARKIACTVGVNLYATDNVRYFSHI